MSIQKLLAKLFPPKVVKDTKGSNGSRGSRSPGASSGTGRAGSAASGGTPASSGAGQRPGAAADSSGVSDTSANQGPGGAPEGSDHWSSAAGEVITHGNFIETEPALADAVQFIGSLNEAIGLAAHLYSSILPLEVLPNQKIVVVLVAPQAKRSEELREVLKTLKQKGYTLRPGPYANLFVTAPQLLLSVARGQLSGSDLLNIKRLQTNKQDSALWQMFVDMISWSYAEKASDIHVNIYSERERSQIKFHIGGKYVGPERWVLPTTTLSQMLGVVYQRARGGAEANFIPTKEQQCNVFTQIRPSGERVMLRWASMATDDGPQVTMRLLQLDTMQQTVSLEQLGYLPSHRAMLERAMKSEGGAIIFAGVVGSGKSTTIATVMGSIPLTRKVMTLEDPREYIIPHSHANTISRPLDGSGDDSFNAKLRTLKRSAFNDLLLGEIRDRETGLVFQDVVLSGQNLYTTTHAKRAIGIADKLASPMVGIERDVLATPGALKLLVYQALLPLTCTSCKVRGDEMLRNPDGERDYGEYLGRIGRLYGFSASQIYFRNKDGCPSCRREGLKDLNGFKGRTVVAEMLELDDEMLQFIKAGDNLGLQQYVGSIPRAAYDDPNMDNKSTLECAIYKMGIGIIDPREVEPRFASFETIELRRIERARMLRRRAQRTGEKQPPVSAVANCPPVVFPDDDDDAAGAAVLAKA